MLCMHSRTSNSIPAVQTQPNVHARQEQLQHLCNNVLSGCMPLYVAGLQSQMVSLQVTGHA